MGTRHLICVFWKGKWYLAQYGQFDGYPEGQGVKIYNFLSVARNIDSLKKGLESHVYQPTPEECNAIWAECEAWDAARRAQGLPVGPKTFGTHEPYPSLSSTISAGILAMIARTTLVDDENDAGGSTEEAGSKKRTPVILELEFANDSLFCEWAYVIDLDKAVLEVYGGSEEKHSNHRFKDVGDEHAPVPALVCSVEFRELYLMRDKGEFLDRVRKALGTDTASEVDDEQVVAEGGTAEGSAEGSAELLGS